MDQERLFHLCQEIIKLKILLKCPICLDIIQDNTVLECGHRFCTQCYCNYKKQFLNQKHSCPLCKKVLDKRSNIYKDDFANKLAGFVFKVCNTVEQGRGLIEGIGPLDCAKPKENIDSFEIGKVPYTEPSTSKCVSKIIKTQKLDKSESDSKQKSVVLTERINQLDCHKKAKPKEIIDTEPSTSKCVPKRKSQKLNKSGSDSKIKRKGVVSSLNAFDELLDAPQDLCVNKKGTLQKYSGKKEDKNEYKILNFKDTSNKQAVLNWLQDNGNKFDRLTQTQNNLDVENDLTDCDVDLKSISQIKRNILRRRKKAQTKKVRTRSLDLEIKPKKDWIHVSTVSALGLDDYTIDEINTEEINKKIKETKLLEDAFLTELENDLINKESKENETIQNSTNDWKRIGKITKMLRKKGKIPKKLKITLEHSKTKIKKEKEIKVVIQKEHLEASTSAAKKEEINVNTEDKDQEQDIPEESPKINIYNFEFERYVEENMTKLSKEHKEDNPLPDSDINDQQKDEKEININSRVGKINLLENIVIKNADVFDPYILPTQKLDNSDPKIENRTIQNENFFENSNDTDLNESLRDLQDFNDVVLSLQDVLKRYRDKFDKNKQITKDDLQNIGKYLNKLNELHVEFRNYIENRAKNVRDFQMQTDQITYSNNEIQTDGLWGKCSKCATKTDSSSAGISNMRRSISKSSGKSTSSKVIENDYFATLDILPFDTQEIVNQHLRKSPVSKDIRLSNKEKNSGSWETARNASVKVKEKQFGVSDPEKNEKSLSKNEDFVCTLKSDVVEKKSASLKRTLSDSDSSDVMVASKKRCNRFVRDDLSIEFEANEGKKTRKENSFTAALSLESDENDEDYLDKILKKYINGSDTPTASKDQPEPEDDLAKMVTSMNKNVKKLLKDEKLCKMTPQHSRDDDMFPNSSKSQKEQTETFNVIPETECTESPLKKSKIKNFNELFDESNVETQLKTSPLKSGRETYCQELEDDMGVDFGNIEIENEEDLFSEEDVVECTPQEENRIEEKRSDSNVEINLTNLFPTEDDVDTETFKDFDLNFVPLLPPPGFEDEENNTPPEDITIIKAQEQQPAASGNERLNGYSGIKTPVKCIEDTLVSNVSALIPSHSTPVVQKNILKETIGISPIVREKSIMERSFSTAVLSNACPETPSRKHNILTSDPKQKSILNYLRQSQESTSKQKPCIACTRLNKDQIQSISLLTNKKLATYSPKFNDSVTHMIVTVDETGRIKDYTMKFVSAVSAGIWIVSFEWIQQCLENNAIVCEEPFEVLDDSCNTGPKTSRLTRITNPLFKDYRFLCVNPLYSTSVEDVEDVITRLGGVTVRNLINLKGSDNKICLIITEGRSTQDFEIYEKWLQKYKVATVDIEWLSRSVSRYKLLSIRPYIWCSDDILDNLGYPSYLVENVYSSSEV